MSRTHQFQTNLALVLDSAQLFLAGVQGALIRIRVHLAVKVESRSRPFPSDQPLAPPRKRDHHDADVAKQGAGSESLPLKQSALEENGA
jgi:hypothetical protein